MLGAVAVVAGLLVAAPLAGGQSGVSKWNGVYTGSDTFTGNGFTGTYSLTWTVSNGRITGTQEGGETEGTVDLNGRSEGKWVGSDNTCTWSKSTMRFTLSSDSAAVAGSYTCTFGSGAINLVRDPATAPPPGPSGPTGDTATVEATGDGATVKRNDGSEEPITGSTTVVVGDEIRTGPVSVTVTVQGGNQVKIGPNTVFKIQGSRRRVQRSRIALGPCFSVNKSLCAGRGRFKCSAQTRRCRWKVSSPNATAASRAGAQFTVEHRAVFTRLFAHSGRVVFSGRRGRSVVVSKGQESVVRGRRGSPGRPRKS